MGVRLVATLALVLCAALPAAAASDEPREPAPDGAARPTIVVTEFFLLDDMVPGPGRRAPGGEAVARRTRELADYVRAAVRNGERYALEPLDTSGRAYQRFENSSGRVFECKSCVADLGRAVDADYVLHGWVQRVSNLIINLNIEIIDSATGKVYDRASVDTRGNTDKSWEDGASYLLRHLALGL